MGSVTVTIGYKYYLGLQFCICQSELTEILSISTNNTSKVILDKGNYPDGADPYVNKPNLYGGRKKGGGVVGQLRFQFGKPNQLPLSYLNSVIPTDPSVPGTMGIVPLRGVSTVTGEQPYICSMNPSMRPWEFKAYRRPSVLKSTNPQTDIEIQPEGIVSADDGFDINPAAMIDECLFDSMWGMGLSENDVDVVSIEAAMTQLKAEGVGMSMRFSDSVGMKKFIRDILTHINGVLYISPHTGKITLRLIRESDPSELTVDSSNIISFDSIERTSWSSTINELTVEYTNKDNYEKASLTLHSAANLSIQGDSVPKTVSYSGFRSQALAARAGARDLSLMAYPIARVEITVDKTAWNITTGSVITLFYPDYGFDGVKFRVLNVDYGDITSGRIKLLAIEDIMKDYTQYSSVFGFSTSPVDSTWNPITTTQAPAVTIYKSTSLPYYAIYNSLSTADFQTYDLALDTFMLLYSKPSNDTNGVYLRDSTGNESQLIIDVWACSLTGMRIGDLRTYYQLNITVQPEGITSIDPATAADITNSVSSFFLLEEEMFIIDTLTINSDGSYKLTVRRGGYDTVPQFHLAATSTEKTYGFIVKDINDISKTYGAVRDNIAISNGNSPYYRILTETFNDLLAYNSAPTVQLVGASRPERPQPVRRVKITYSSSRMYIRWSVDSKLLTLSNPPSEFTIAGSAEPNSEFRIIIRDHFNTVLKDVVVTGVGYDLLRTDEIAATQDGIVSPSVYVEILPRLSTDIGNISYQKTRAHSFRPWVYLANWSEHIARIGNATDFNHVDSTLSKQYLYTCADGSKVVVTGAVNDATIYVCDENGVPSTTLTGGNLIGMLSGGTHDWLSVYGNSAATAKILWTTDGVTFNVADVATVNTTITSTFSIADVGFNSASQVLIDTSNVFISDRTQVYGTVDALIEGGVPSGTTVNLKGVVHIAALDGSAQTSVSGIFPPSGDRAVLSNNQYAIDMFRSNNQGEVYVTWRTPYSGAAGQDYTVQVHVDRVKASTSTSSEIGLGVSGVTGLEALYVVSGPNGAAVISQVVGSSFYISYVSGIGTVASWANQWTRLGGLNEKTDETSGFSNIKYPVSVGATHLYATAEDEFPNSVINQQHRPRYVVPNLYVGPVDDRAPAIAMYGEYNTLYPGKAADDGMHYFGSVFKYSLSTGAVVSSGWSHDNPFFVKGANSDLSDPGNSYAYAQDKIGRILAVDSTETKILTCTKYTGRAYWITIQ